MNIHVYVFRCVATDVAMACGETAVCVFTDEFSHTIFTCDVCNHVTELDIRW